MPANAGIQLSAEFAGVFNSWIPAFAGMTVFCRDSLRIAGKNPAIVTPAHAGIHCSID